MNERTKYVIWIKDSLDGRGELTRDAALRIVYELREAGYEAVAMPVDFNPSMPAALSADEWTRLFGY